MKMSSELSVEQCRQLFKLAAVMPRKLETKLKGLSPVELQQRTSGLEFSLHEQVWHLADLETQGFAKRIRLLLVEKDPSLPDFNGSEVAASRHYHALSIQQGLRTFADARLYNLWLLSSVSADAWKNSGKQEGLGRMSLGDVFQAMVAHDQSHLVEVEFLLSGNGSVEQPHFKSLSFAAA